MATNLRLTIEEQEQLRNKSIEINKKLVSEGQAPLKESELMHKILKEIIPLICVKKGKITLEIL